MDPREVKTTEAHDRGGVEFPRFHPDSLPKVGLKGSFGDHLVLVKKKAVLAYGKNMSPLQF